MIMISDERIDMLLQQLDVEARAYYIGDEYGLPTHHEETNQKMRAAVREFFHLCIAQMAINTDREILAMDKHEAVVGQAEDLIDSKTTVGIIGINTLRLNADSM